MSMLLAKINAALDKIGFSNGTAAPASQDPADPILHELLVSSRGASYFDARKKKAIEALKAAVATNAATQKKFDKAIAEVKASEFKQDVELMRGAEYAGSVEIKNGASFLDVPALRVKLLLKMKTADVDKLFAECTSRRDPSQSFKVTENSE